jgi:hypothetical protein
MLVVACYSTAELYFSSDASSVPEGLGPATQATAAVLLVICQCYVVFLAYSYRIRILQQAQVKEKMNTFVLVFAFCAILLAVRASLLLWIATDADRKSLPNMFESTEAKAFILIADVVPRVLSSLCLIYLMWTPDITRGRYVVGILEHRFSPHCTDSLSLWY